MLGDWLHGCAVSNSPQICIGLVRPYHPSLLWIKHSPKINPARHGKAPSRAVFCSISLRQPFTAPAVTPSMNCFCARKNTTSEGMMEMSDTAITRFQAKPVSASMDMRTNSVAG